ncbi:MAG TPA: MarR family transcriptional regulator [Actinomycetes bacterium]|nr:MarR family transcriptional regulator [Actinomycetes bacterium]
MTSSEELLSDERLTALGLLEETRAGLHERFAEQLGTHGLAELDFEVLLRLGRSPDTRLRMSDLASQVNMSASGLTRVIDRLEAADLVARMTCREDRRGTWATVTEAGIARLHAALPDHLQLIQKWYVGVLEPDELTELTRLLRKLRDVVRPQAVAGASPGH